MIPITRLLPPLEFNLTAMRVRPVVLAQITQSPDRRIDWSVLRRLREIARVGLLVMTSGKCAYCESQVEAADAGEIDEYRPKLIYPWLATEWSNLHVVCRQCNVFKAARFPIEGPRAELGATEEQLKAERPQLLDPAVDDPLMHLVFDREGRVTGRDDRGKTTIDVLGLNRESLVARRMKVASRARRILGLISTEKASFESVRELFEVGAPYVAVSLSIVREWWMRHPPVRRDGYVRTLRREGFAWVAEALTEPPPQPPMAAIESPDARGLDPEIDVYRAIRRITIENFRAIASLELVFDDGLDDADPRLEAVDAILGRVSMGPGKQAGWVVLLGENGAGKTSVLQALALALAGRRWIRENPGLCETAKLLRYQCDHGFVRVELASLDEPIELVLDSKEDFVVSSLEEALFPLLGFGATRVSGKVSGQVKSPGQVHLANLFDPQGTLIEPGVWLRGLGEVQWRDVVKALREIIDNGNRVDFDRSGPEVTVSLYGADSRLSDLSSGYQSVISMVCEILSVLVKKGGPIEGAEGVILLDELGTHLHPRWRMQIVGRLRRALPRVQFVSSTHEPLCLKGLRQGEVALLRRQNGVGSVEAVVDLPSPQGLRVDQLLCSEFFGLQSVIDPDVEAMQVRYQDLLALPERSTEQDRDLMTLESALGALDVLGGTEREQLMYSVIDQYIGQRRRIGTEIAERSELKEHTRQILKTIWQTLGDRAGSR